MNKVTIILPALNEAGAIGDVIDGIPMEALEGYHVEILVVDNGSTDRTAEIAREKGAVVITEHRKGKGRAIRTAFEQVNADFVFMLDADYTYPADYIPEMLDLLKDYPVVIGSRLKGVRLQGAMSNCNLLGNRLLSLLARILYRVPISDVCTGYWGFRGEVIPQLKLTAKKFTLEAEILSQVARLGYPIGEIPIHYRCSPTSSKLNPVGDAVKIALKLITAKFIKIGW